MQSATLGGGTQGGVGAAEHGGAGLERRSEVNGVVPSQTLDIGELGCSRHELVGDRHQVEDPKQRLELTNGVTRLSHGQSSPATGGGDRGACFDRDEAHRCDGVGRGPNQRCSIRAILVDDQLEQHRRVDVGDHLGQRRCSATSSLTLPLALIRRFGR